MTAIKQIPVHLQDAHANFGRALKNWMATNNFSQQVPHDWSLMRRAAGLDHDITPGPWNSSTSLLQRGMSLPCGVGVWEAWAHFNRCIADEDLSGITNTRLCKLIKNAEPFLTIDETVAGTMDFFGMFAGLLEINPSYLKNYQKPASTKVINITQKLAQLTPAEHAQLVKILGNR